MTLLFVLCTALALLVTLLPLSRHPHWIIRGMDFPRLQFAILIATLLVAELLVLNLQSLLTWLLISIATLCLIWQLWWILPYTFLWRAEVKKAGSSIENQISILTANVLTPNRNAHLLLQLVKEHHPDVLVTLESDQWWEDQLKVLEADMPYSVKCPLDNLYGMHVFSILPLDDQEISYLVEEAIPSIHTTLRLRSGVRVRMHFLHPAPPSPTENPESAERDAELVIVARSVAESDQPVIVTGDLNDVAWSATTRLFRKISGLLDPRVGRGMFNTFHADYPFLRWPLDHLFHSHHFTLNSIKRLPSIGSDHFALLTRLTFSPIKGADQQGLDSDASDHNWARDIAEEQDVSKDDVPEPGESKPNG
ncbi:endonuclease/exonuclease/phosphatase family protein [uncultured Paraglaciecola sp.]|uniref:endonuclease/exonuclease/phosphatase family protein n=1 Tax=uncultured Paraglaciecola sp. TaxID=1765024 RepID=UPI0030D965DE|tara:strand:+ start:30503 stop:31597 length:1095 start_codon:yes stop_codon:yes gene_type:complete